MQKKSKELNESLAQNHDALEEILGDIKDVVSGETETRFKSQIKQKVVKLKKSDLVDCNSKNKNGSGSSYIEKSELEALIRKIVRQELIKKEEFLSEKKRLKYLKMEILYLVSIETKNMTLLLLKL